MAGRLINTERSEYFDLLNMPNFKPGSKS